MTDTIPVSSSTDWQAAFGFGSSTKPQDDDLGFDPFDITSKALADLIENELSVQDRSSTSFPNNHIPPAPGFTPQIPNSHHTAPTGKAPLLHPVSSIHIPPNCGLALCAFSQYPQLPQRPGYASFSFSGHTQTSRHSWLAMSAHSNLSQLNHSVTQHSSFLDLSLPSQQQLHNTGLGGIPITGEFIGCY